MTHITVQLEKRSYPILVGKNILSLKSFQHHIQTQRISIVTNTTVGSLYLNQIEQLLSAYKLDVITLPDGEQYKTLNSFEQVCEHLLQNKHNRDTTLIALGGGVIGDLTGFVAACYQRGVNFIQIPTSLLAQVDSSVGGKTAVNHALGKNMIGAFYQPQAVLIDTNFLNTLEARQVSAGIAEIIKYALISDDDFFMWLEKNISSVLNLEQEALIYAITQSCTIKARIVAADEKENNLRAVLNFGHTLGHAIETCQNYTGLLHGEAVAVGMLFATFISENIDPSIFERLKTLLLAANLPTTIPSNLSVQALQQAMAIDKKITQGQAKWIVLKKLGSAYISDTISSQYIENKILAFMSV